MSSHDKRIVDAQPFVDEWGIYDPEQAGVAALLARLDSRPQTPTSLADARAMAVSMREAKKLSDEQAHRLP